MIRSKNFLKNILFAWTLSLPTTAMLAQDSSANSSTFVNIVKETQGFLIRVELNEDGLEDGSTASARIYLGDEQIGEDLDLKGIWDQSFDVSNIKQVSEDDISNDSSTWGWYSYKRSGFHNRHYRSYRPYYYDRGHRYSYGKPSYRSYYGGYSSRRNHRYYYYPRYY